MLQKSEDDIKASIDLRKLMVREDGLSIIRDMIFGGKITFTDDRFSLRVLFAIQTAAKTSMYASAAQQLLHDIIVGKFPIAFSSTANRRNC